MAEMRIVENNGEPLEKIFWISPTGIRYEVIGSEEYRHPDTGCIFNQAELWREYA